MIATQKNDIFFGVRMQCGARSGTAVERMVTKFDIVESTIVRLNQG